MEEVHFVFPGVAMSFVPKMAISVNWVIIYHLPPIKGTRNSYWLSWKEQDFFFQRLIKVLWLDTITTNHQKMKTEIYTRWTPDPVINWGLELITPYKMAENIHGRKLGWL